MPRVAVVIPSYNAAEHIRETLQSVLSQEGVDFDVLLLDDASSDNTVEIAHSFEDPRLRVVQNRVNLGRVGNMNQSFGMISAEYVARLDHDDVAAPGRLALQASFLDKHPSVTIVGSQMQLFDTCSDLSDFPLDDATIKARFVVGAGYIGNPCTMYRLGFMQQHALRFDPNYYIVDDLGLFFDAMLCGARFANLPQALTRYRVHRTMTSLNLDGHALYQAKRRLYSRLLPTYFPRLTGRDVDALLPIYSMAPPSGKVGELERLHSAARVAMEEVNPIWDINAEEARACLLHLLNQHRAKWLADGLISDAQGAALDQIYYGSA
jgi:glycosyltransferase involved in cell wall biosynthesis